VVKEMERVGILVISYGSRAAAIVDAFCRSLKYKADLYVVDKQKNPFNVKKAKKHIVIPSFDLKKISKFVMKYKDYINFGIVGPEKPIISGIRDIIENETKVPLICPTKEYAIEVSKIAQRQLFQEVVPEANPRYKIFDPKDLKNLYDVKKPLYDWLDELENRVAVKPDSTSAGKGVGIWGDHFQTRKEIYDHFIDNFMEGPVLVEEKLEGEESSYQAFCDGKSLTQLPETRDYKRAFDGDNGPNTGGMGSYKDVANFLPYMSKNDLEVENRIVNKIFNKLKGDGYNSALRGIPFYVAFIHTKKGPMILENNSRPGDPEIMNILPILKDDLIDVCYKMIEGSLNNIEFYKKATVATYKVPINYGGYAEKSNVLFTKSDVKTPVLLDDAYNLSSKYCDNIRIYPGSMEIKNDGNVYALNSRTVCSVGIGDDIQHARELSLKGLYAIKGGALWNRKDIASKKHIEISIKHMRLLLDT
jgi:phosphoribosylamine--glycine ligase